MAVIKFLFTGIMSFILLIAYLIVVIGGLWVLRVAIDWWLDIDYVKKLKTWVEKQNDKELK